MNPTIVTLLDILKGLGILVLILLLIFICYVIIAAFFESVLGLLERRKAMKVFKKEADKLINQINKENNKKTIDK